GGFAVAGTVTGDGVPGAAISLGGKGGKGGSGGAVNVSSGLGITTGGNDATAVLAQSIGGGGGNGGLAVAGDLAVDSVGFAVSIGGSGGDGGLGGAVVVNTSGGTITTAGDHSEGILAQSVGGGGGR